MKIFVFNIIVDISNELLDNPFEETLAEMPQNFSFCLNDEVDDYEIENLIYDEIVDRFGNGNYVFEFKIEK